MIRQPVLVLTSGDAGRRALELAISVTQAHRACLTIMHVLDTSPPWWAGTGGGADFAQAQREAHRDGERLLAAVRDELPGDVLVRTCVLHGAERAGVQVLRALKRGDHDLLVVEAPSAWTGPAGHGSGWLVRHSPVPVLTVRAPCG
ncbi:universal stress protein [Patulibacter sp. NPDC049589]|uniref:universal stress protein n=1 Tax=Patulibacter sp. NPDC049589 TaxID=3154731 RepID=UPI003425818B